MLPRAAQVPQAESGQPSNPGLRRAQATVTFRPCKEPLARLAENHCETPGTAWEDPPPEFTEKEPKQEERKRKPSPWLAACTLPPPLHWGTGRRVSRVSYLPSHTSAVVAGVALSYKNVMGCGQRWISQSGHAW